MIFFEGLPAVEIEQDKTPHKPGPHVTLVNNLKDEEWNGVMETEGFRSQKTQPHAPFCQLQALYVWGFFFLF